MKQERTFWIYAPGHCWRRIEGFYTITDIRRIANGLKPYCIKVSLRRLKEGLYGLQENTAVIVESKTNPSHYFCPDARHNKECFFLKQKELF